MQCVMCSYPSVPDVAAEQESFFQEEEDDELMLSSSGSEEEDISDDMQSVSSVRDRQCADIKLISLYCVWPILDYRPCIIVLIFLSHIGYGC